MICEIASAFGLARAEGVPSGPFHTSPPHKPPPLLEHTDEEKLKRLALASLLCQLARIVPVERVGNSADRHPMTIPVWQTQLPAPDAHLLDRTAERRRNVNHRGAVIPCFAEKPILWVR